MDRGQSTATDSINDSVQNYLSVTKTDIQLSKTEGTTLGINKTVDNSPNVTSVNYKNT